MDDRIHGDQAQDQQALPAINPRGVRGEMRDLVVGAACDLLGQGDCLLGKTHAASIPKRSRFLPLHRYSFVPSSEDVAIEHELPDGRGTKRTVIAQPDSEADARRILDDIAEQTHTPHPRTDCGSPTAIPPQRRPAAASDTAVR